MALIDDYDIDLRGKRRHIDAASGTFYSVRDLYSLDMNLADEEGATALPGYMAFPVAFEANTPTDIVLVSGTYLTQESYKRLNGGSIQTSGFDGEIYLLSMQASGYTSAIAGDIGKTVTDGSGGEGTLLDYDNTQRKWWVRQTSGSFGNSTAYTINSGTGAGTTEASNGFLTGEDGHSNVFGLGTVLHWGATYFALDGTVYDLVSDGWYASAPSTAFDILIKVKEAGSLIGSGTVTFYNRCNRDLANSLDGATEGDTYDWFEADISNFGRNPIPLNTRADLDDTLTNAEAEDYVDGTSSTIALATSGPYNVDVDQDSSNEAYSGQVDHDEQTNAVVWSVIKYVFRKGATDTVDGVEAQQYRYLDNSYAVTKDSPIATIAGGTIYYARGWVPVNVNSSDASNYRTVPDAGGAPISPPVFYIRAVSGVPDGARVTLARRSAPDTTLVDEFTLAAGNDSGDGTLVIQESIPADKPSSGYVRVFDDDGNEDRYAYTSFSGSTFTLSGTLSKTYSSGNSAYVAYLDGTVTGGSGGLSEALRYVAARDVVLNVRLGSGASKIKPFSSNFTLGEADSSVPATAIADTINNN